MTNEVVTNENPALAIDDLIKQYDQFLKTSGVQPILTSVAAAKSQNYESVVTYLADIMNSISFAKLLPKYENILEIVAELIASLDEESYFSHLDLPAIPALGHDNAANLKEFMNYIAQVKVLIQPLIDDAVGSNKNNQLLSAINNKKKILDKGFFYEFTDGDLDRIQELINELRKEITVSDLFDDSHRRRLLRRLEAMQSEMHKKMSDVDRIWGLVGDAGIVIGKFGKDSKPFVDRIKELSQIAWKTQARAEELPSSSQNPLLGNEEE
ncbi:hypothetical protein CXF85_18105 [Colwellia sp. 75C3]|uniref:hypothetical protein n=1 Tax=Colwellia sp. 75C3 TaxID=888425 RepID=UPI000C331B65|nr:hypothetical protein [Colwellia sp. 75C3]PKG81386.1 hypothetical protein CXF85_18105 [Colwellia sp. 75C3]